MNEQPNPQAPPKKPKEPHKPPKPGGFWADSPEARAERVRALVASAPKSTPEQVAVLRSVFRPQQRRRAA
jgi:hypothetical protein